LRCDVRLDFGVDAGSPLAPVAWASFFTVRKAAAKKSVSELSSRPAPSVPCFPGRSRASTVSGSFRSIPVPRQLVDVVAGFHLFHWLALDVGLNGSDREC
jgi:hypothetical protein